jgi:hypothetical protein
MQAGIHQTLNGIRPIYEAELRKGDRISYALVDALRNLARLSARAHAQQGLRSEAARPRNDGFKFLIISRRPTLFPAIIGLFRSPRILMRAIHAASLERSNKKSWLRLGNDFPPRSQPPTDPNRSYASPATALTGCRVVQSELYTFWVHPAASRAAIVFTRSQVFSRRSHPVS